MKLLFGQISPISISTYNEVIIYGKWTGIHVPKWIAKIVVKFLDWRFDIRHKHKAGTVCNERCLI